VVDLVLLPEGVVRPRMVIDAMVSRFVAKTTRDEP
jgi:hypothetical protein